MISDNVLCVCVTQRCVLLISNSRSLDMLMMVRTSVSHQVAQGFLQRAFGSYQPDETYSPVVHKGTLLMFMSLCAAEDLEVYVKSAFLQSSLKESIFLRAPGLFFQDCGRRRGDP